jgi:hypothetical protein
MTTECQIEKEMRFGGARDVALKAVVLKTGGRFRTVVI